MMKSAGRFAAVLLALLPLLASCGGGGKPEHPDSGTHPETTEGIVIAGEGDVLFTVVRPMDANEDEKKGAEAVAAVLGQFAGVTVRVSDDYLLHGEEPEANEILIGATNRRETAGVMAELPENGYAVTVRNGKTVICGRSANLVGLAADYFIDTVLGYDTVSGGFRVKTEKLTVPKGLNYISEWSSPLTGYTIVYPYKKYNGREFVAAKLLRDRIEQTTGLRLTVTDDYEENEKEILIGRTRRAESGQVYSGLSSGGGYGRIGSRIVIFGATDYTVDAACDYFVNTVLGYDSVTGQKSGKPDFSPVESEKISYIDGGEKTAERLYNNIVIDGTWPPRDVDLADSSVIDIPYLRSEKDGGTHPGTVDISVGRQLFVDSFLVGKTNLKTTYHQAVPDKNPLITAEDGLLCLSHGGMAYDEKAGVVRMWFLMFGKTRFLRCMESRDGITWVKAGDSEALDSDASYVTVIENPKPSPDGSDRYVMLVRRSDNSFGWEKHYETARYASQLYCSSDGMKWKYVSEAGLCGDATTLSYNRFRNKWVFCLRDYSHFSKNVKRAVRYYECSDILKNGKFGMWQAVEWQRTDNLDKPDPTIGCEPEFYNLCTVSYESIQLGAFQYWLGPTNEEINKTGLPKITDIQLGYSRDGFHFSRPEREVPAIACSRKEGTWDYGYLHSVSSLLLTTDDELWFYYSGYRGGEKQDYAPAPEYSFPSIGRAVMRRDGFASLDGSGEVTTCRLTVKGGKYLFINAKADSLKAELIGSDGNVIPGYSADDCVPFSGDSCRAMLKWKGGDDLSFLDGSEFSIRFITGNAEFYSFWLSSGTDGDSGGYYGAGLIG